MMRCLLAACVALNGLTIYIEEDAPDEWLQEWCAIQQPGLELPYRGCSISEDSICLIWIDDTLALANIRSWFYRELEKCNGDGP